MTSSTDSFSHGRFRRLLRAVLANGLAILVGIALSLLVGEGLVRLAFHRSMDFDMEMWKYASNIKERNDDPQIVYGHRAGASEILMGAEVDTNQFGLRGGPTTLEKPPGTYRVAVVGDSITLGWGVAEEDTYPRQLERMLNENPPDGFPIDVHYEVLNLGVGNYNTTQEIGRLREVGLPMNPDLILLGYFINDAEPTPQPHDNWLIEHSYLYAFTLSRLRILQLGDAAPTTYKEYYRGLYEADRPGWMATQEALGELANIGRETGTPVAIFIIPELHDLSSNYPFAEISTSLLKLGEDLDVPMVDLYPDFAGFSPEEQLWVSPTDAHHNSQAQAMLAQGIYDALDRGLVEP